jgi:hypothetical protein
MQTKFTSKGRPVLATYSSSCPNRLPTSGLELGQTVLRGLFHAPITHSEYLPSLLVAIHNLSFRGRPRMLSIRDIDPVLPIEGTYIEQWRPIHERPQHKP